MADSVPSHEYPSQSSEVLRHGLPVIQLAPGNLDDLIVSTSQFLADHPVPLGRLRPSVEGFAHSVKVHADPVLDTVGILEEEVWKSGAEGTAKFDGNLSPVSIESSFVEHCLEGFLVEVHGFPVALGIVQARRNLVRIRRLQP